MYPSRLVTSVTFQSLYELPLNALPFFVPQQLVLMQLMSLRLVFNHIIVHIILCCVVSCDSPISHMSRIIGSPIWCTYAARRTHRYGARCLSRLGMVLPTRPSCRRGT